MPLDLKLTEVGKTNTDRASVWQSFSTGNYPFVSEGTSVHVVAKLVRVNKKDTLIGNEIGNLSHCLAEDDRLRSVVSADAVL